ncbi:MAG: recombinase family protein [Methylocella sp.]
MGDAILAQLQATLDAQVAALKAAGAVRVFRETASGAKTDRRELARAIKFLGKGHAGESCRQGCALSFAA